MQPPIHYRPIVELGRAIRTGELTAAAVTEHFIERIDALEPRLRAFTVVCRDRALAQARAADAQLGAGIDLGPLHGIPYVAKDLYDVAGLPTTAGTRLLANNVPASDCAVVARLTRAGMVLLGKTITVQFAYGGAGINTDHGTPHNPWHPEPHLPGGSSSGTGVAVAAGMAPMGLGSDTGGSVRIPASMCGVTGLKTTVGRISRAGIYPLSASLDSVGPLTRDAADAAIVYEAMQGHDPADSTTRGQTPHDVTSGIDRGVSGLTLGVPRAVFWEDCDAEVERLVREAIAHVESLGATVIDIDFEQAESARRLNPRGLVIAAEAYDVNRRLVDSSFDELDPIVAFRIVKGRDIPAHEYLATVRAWEELRAETVTALDGIDGLLCPTVMVPPVPVADALASTETYAERNLQTLRNTSIGNILALCGLSVPCGFTTSGLPVGLMIYGKPFDEAPVLRAGHAYQRSTDWHRRHPALDRLG